MDTSSLILNDLQLVYKENHRDFSFLNLYKGVPVICRAYMERVEGQAVVFTVQPPESAALQAEKTTLVLSDGLLEPLEAQITCESLVKGEFHLKEFAYAGSKFANRRELRVQPSVKLAVEIAGNGFVVPGEIIDLSVRGMGIRLPEHELKSIFEAGNTVALTLYLPKKEKVLDRKPVTKPRKLVMTEVRLEGKIRNMARTPGFVRLAVEFTGIVPEKATIIQYVMERRAEIIGEIRRLYEQAVRAA